MDGVDTDGYGDGVDVNGWLDFMIVIANVYLE
jgi:hypothetical protein